MTNTDLSAAKKCIQDNINNCSGIITPGLATNIFNTAITLIAQVEVVTNYVIYTTNQIPLSDLISSLDDYDTNENEELFVDFSEISNNKILLVSKEIAPVSVKTRKPIIEFLQSYVNEHNTKIVNSALMEL